jgi:hypothetical protein
VEPVGGASERDAWAAPDSAAAGAGHVSPPPLRRDEDAAGGADARPAPRLPVPLRPMTLSDLLDGPFRVIKSKPRTVFGIAAAILIPTDLVGAFLQRNTVHASVFSGSVLTGTTLFSSGGDLLALVVSGMLQAAALFFLGGALARLLSAWYAGGDLTAGQALRASFSRGWALIGAFLLLFPVKVASYAACYFPVIATVTLFSVTAPAIVIEGLGPIAGAARSWRLVWRRFWPSVLTIVVATFGSNILTSVFSFIPLGLAQLLPGPLDWIAVGVVQAAIAMLVTTALVSVAVLLYLDLRIRTEGLDIELDAADAFRHAR